MNGFSLFLCASNTRTETIYRFTTTSSMSKSLSTLGSTSLLASTSTSTLTSTSTSGSGHHHVTTAHISLGTSVTDKSVSGASLSITTATDQAENGLTSQGTSSYTSMSANPAAALSASPSSIVGVVLGGVGRCKSLRIIKVQKFASKHISDSRGFASLVAALAIVAGFLYVVYQLLRAKKNRHPKLCDRRRRRRRHKSKRRSESPERASSIELRTRTRR